MSLYPIPHHAHIVARRGPTEMDLAHARPRRWRSRLPCWGWRIGQEAPALPVVQCEVLATGGIDADPRAARGLHLGGTGTGPTQDRLAIAIHRHRHGMGAAADLEPQGVA